MIAVTKANLDQPPRECTSEDPVAPAKAAGFAAGDRIVSFNGTRVHELGAGAARDPGQRRPRPPASWSSATAREVTLRPSTVVSPRLDPDNPERITKVGFLGVVPTTERERQGLGFVVTTMADGTWETLQGDRRDAGEGLPRGAGGRRRSRSVTHRADERRRRRAGSPARWPPQDRSSYGDRFFSLIVLLAGLNLFLGLINLVPLPPFDGGGIATTLYEAVRRWIARLRHRPDPGGFDSAKLLPVTYVMAGRHPAGEHRADLRRHRGARLDQLNCTLARP